ncbi:hypothetical protein N0V90_005239 [Kalmusia sp. IMI 367209]|nr:hypothetical protein N0V90_005239 [Kalmusia sp. IMI 367209]
MPPQKRSASISASPRRNSKKLKKGSVPTPLRQFDLAALLSKRYVPIQKILLSFLGPLELFALKRTAKTFSSVMGDLRTTNFNINKRLEPFFDDPIEFRRQQFMWGGLVSGPFADEFFARTGEAAKVMELYVYEHYVENALVHDYLIDRGWSGDALDYKKTHTKFGELKIEIIPDHDPPVLGFLQRAITTCGLNFITWNKAFALFPRATFVRNESYILTDWNEELSEALVNISEKHDRKTIHLPLDERAEADLAAPRRIGDKKTWVIDLDMAGLTKAVHNDPDVAVEDDAEVYVEDGSVVDIEEDLEADATPEWAMTDNFPSELDIEHTTFRLRAKRGSANILDRYDMCARVGIRHGVLDFGYVTMGWGGDNADQIERFNDNVNVGVIKEYLETIDRAQKKVRDYTVVEMGKLPDNDKPEEYRPIPGLPPPIVPLEGWSMNYFFLWPYPKWRLAYDDEVVELLDAAWDRAENGWQMSMEK